MHRTRLAAVVGTVALAGALVTGSPAAPAVAAPDDDAAAPALKPFAAGVVQIDPEAVADGEVAVTTDPQPGQTDAELIVTGTGTAEVATVDDQVGDAESTTTTPVEVGEGQDPTDPAAAAVAPTDESTVVATLTTAAPDGTTRTSSDTVWVDDFRGHTLVSERGEQDLRLQRVDVIEDDGTITAAQAAALRAQVLGGGGRTTESAVPEAACHANRVCLSGTIRWTDSIGGTHPVASAPVEIRDREGASSVRITTVTTTATGHYEAAFTNNDGDGTRRDIFIRVKANGPGFTMAQFIDSTVTNNIRLGNRVKNLTANNVADNNTAFSIQAALVRASKYVKAVNGALFAPVPVVFPSDGSYFDGSALNLLQLDRWDWDVTLHEFGHYLAAQLNIENNPGGNHSFSDNLSVRYGDKGIGTRLAWGEGWPSFFAVSALDPVTGIPLVGDDHYQDTEDANINISLEDPATLGEDNERTVMNTFWDLYDTHVDGRDNVALTGDAIWDTLNAADPTTLSAAYQAFSPSQATEGTNCIFSDMNVAPDVTGPVSVSTPAPTIQWARGNGGTHLNTSFTVVFRSNTNGVLTTVLGLTGTSYTPSQGTWDTIRSGAGGTVRVTVTGSQDDSPVTGPYRHCTRSYSL